MDEDITGLILTNQTDFHHHFSSLYRNDEMTLILKKRNWRWQRHKQNIITKFWRDYRDAFFVSKNNNVDFIAVCKKLSVTNKRAFNQADTSESWRKVMSTNFKVLLNPSTTDPPTTKKPTIDYLLTDPPTQWPLIYATTDSIIIFKRLCNRKIKFCRSNHSFEMICLYNFERQQKKRCFPPKETRKNKWSFLSKF